MAPALAQDPDPWTKGADEYILQAQGFRNQATESWRWTLTAAAAHYVSAKTQVGAVVSVLRDGSDGGAGIGPWYEYTLGCTQKDLCFIIGGDAQKLTAGAEDLAAWQAATRGGIKWTTGNIGIRFTVEWATALDSKTETTITKANGEAALHDDGEPPFIIETEDLGDRLDRIGMAFGFSWGK
jgi:hypothetical protein